MLNDKQFNRIEELVDEKRTDLHQAITNLINKFVDEIVSGIHDTSRALTKATNVDDTLFEDFKALDEDPAAKALVELCIVDTISKDFGPRFFGNTKESCRSFVGVEDEKAYKSFFTLRREGKRIL